MRTRTKVDRMAIMFLALLVGIGMITGGTAIVRLPAGDRPILVVRSPDGSEQLALHHAKRWQWLLHPTTDMLGYAQLSRAATGETLATSEPFELSDSGPVIWSDQGVQIGTAAVFDRRTQQWSVED